SVRTQAVHSAASGAVAAATPAAEPAAAAPVTSAAASAPADGPALRRGLPRMAGGDPWPPAGVALARAASLPQLQDPFLGSGTQPPPTSAAAPAPGTAPAQAVVAASAPSQAQSPDVSTPLPFTRTVWQGTTPRYATEPEREPSRLRPTWPQAIGGLLGLAALGLVAVACVFLIRAFLSLSFMQDFLATY